MSPLTRTTATRAVIRKVACALAVALVSARASDALDLSAKVTPLADPLIEKGVAVGFVVGIVKAGEQQVLAYGETEKGSGMAPDGESSYP